MYQKLVVLIFIQVSYTVSCKSQNNNKFMESDTLLTYISRESKDSSANSPLLILLHGHGSNENYLFSLNTQIPENWIVVSVRGTYKLNQNSYRWYDVKMTNGKITINIDEEETSRRKLVLLLKDLSKKYKVDDSKIVVAGFSQGANMAQALGLSEPTLVSGFGVFSGRFVEEFIPYISTSSELKNTKAFLSHGSSDIMLPKSYAVENLGKLKELGIQITYCEDANGHSISTKQWSEFSNWLLNFTK
jgi:phospholipase/carboxylesterase